MSYAAFARANRDQLAHVATTYINAMNVWREARENTVKAFKFAEGGYWNWATEAASALKLAGFPTINLNIILPRILRLSGFQRLNRTSVTAIPTQNAGQPDAEIATRLLAWSDTLSCTDEEVSRAFVHALISRLGGWLETTWDRSIDPLGVPIVTHVNPLYMTPDPAYPLYDHKQARFLIKSFWTTAENVMLSFPESRDEVTAILGDVHSQRMLAEETGGSWMAVGGSEEELNDEFVNVKENLFRVIEMQERRKRKQIFAVNQTNNKMVEVESIAMAQEIANRYPNIEIGERVIDDIWTITTLGDFVLLQEVQNEIQNRQFTIVPVLGYNFGGKQVSLVEALFGAQEEYEKSRSAGLHKLHTSAASGWQWEEGSLTPEMEKRLEAKGSAPGLLLKYTPGARAPQQIFGAPFDRAEVERAQLALMDADNISAIGRGELGQGEGKGESGVLFQSKIQASNETFTLLMTQLGQTRIQVARNQLALIQKKMKPGRIVTIVGEESEVAKITVDEKLNIGQYEIKLIEGVHSPTQRLRRLMEADMLIQRMPPELVPWHLYISMLDWPDQNKWKEYIAQRLGVAPADQQEFLESLQAMQSGLGHDAEAGKSLDVIDNDPRQPLNIEPYNDI